MRRSVLLLGLVLTALWTVPRIATAASDSSGTHSYTSTCEAGLPRFTNTSDPFSTGNGVIEFRAAGATLTLSPGQSGVLEPDEVTPNTPWDVVFFDLGEPYVFDGGTFGICESPTTSTTVPPTYSVSVAEGCNNGEPVVNFTNTGTGTMYATIGVSAQPVEPGATVTAPWPMAQGDPYPEFDWHAAEFPDPTGDVGPSFATGSVSLANACGVASGPVDSPNAVVRNIGAAIPAALVPLIAAAPTPVATFEGSGTTALDLGSGLLADDELYLLDVVFTAGSDSDTLIIHELDENFEDRGSVVSWSDGSFEGRFLLNRGDTTARYLRVETQGSWTFTIWPFLTSVEQWPGGEVHGAGPNVLLFIGDRGVVSFAHRGERDFVVGFYGDDGYPDASVNELENVDGTVIVPISPAVVVVDGDGEWWLRR